MFCNESTFRKILDLEKIQNFQNDIAYSTGLAALTVDFRGVPVTEHSNCSQFCSFVRSNQKYGYICQKCDAIAGVEAARIMKPHIYFCHFGLIDIAVPILHEENYLGAILIGQTQIQNEEDIDLDAIVENNKKIDVNTFPKQAIEYYKNIQTHSLKEIKSIANLIFYLSEYMVSNAFLKQQINLMNNSFQKTMKNFEMESIQPAIQYIENNFTKDINVEYLAELCYSSYSNFLKMFKHQTGQTIINYISDKRIEHSKQYLIDTSRPIYEIASELGYSECSYFNRVFKKKENITPSQFRKMYQEG